MSGIYPLAGMISYSQTTPMDTESASARATFSSRAWAITLDGFISGALMLALGLAAILIFVPAPTDLFSLTDLPDKLTQGLMGKDVGPLIPWRFRLTIWLFLSVGAVYSLSEVVFAQSPGKLLMGIQIRDLNGHPSSKLLRLKRYGFKYGGQLAALLSLVLGSTEIAVVSEIWGLAFTLGCLLALGSTRLALHDMLSDSAVYPVNYRPEGRDSIPR